MSNPCDGCKPGYCPRHCLYKSPTEVRTCEYDEKTRRFLDRTADERCNELAGHKIGRLLTKAGITKERYGAVKQLIGLPPDCDCDARRDWINKLHALAKGLF